MSMHSSSGSCTETSFGHQLGTSRHRLKSDPFKFDGICVITALHRYSVWVVTFCIIVSLSKAGSGFNNAKWEPTNGCQRSNLVDIGNSSGSGTRDIKPSFPSVEIWRTYINKNWKIVQLLQIHPYQKSHETEKRAYVALYRTWNQFIFFQAICNQQSNSIQ